jgi:AraC family transcriptional regulator, regulatory protein of adaptative response / methylated-DNA-[protein]-cysteine methyltransferase
MSTASSNDEELWSAVQGRDASRDGEFFYGVMTTGVYCRPSCNSRRPLRKNVRFFTTTETPSARAYALASVADRRALR